METPLVRTDEMSGRPASLVRESRFSQTGHFAPAILATAAACAWAFSISRGAPALRILAALLAAAAATVVILREVARSRADPSRTTGTAVGVLLTALMALQAFSGSVSAFLVRAFGPHAFGIPITWAAALATATLLGPPLIAGGPSLVVLNLAAMREGAFGGRVRMVLWLVGAAGVPDDLRSDRNRVRASLAWMGAVFAAWIGYTAWRGI